MISSQSPSSGTRGYQHGPLKIMQQFDLGLFDLGLARDILLSRFQWAKLPRVSSFDGLMVGRCLAELSVPRNLAMQGNVALLEARIERTSSSWLPFGVFDRFEGIPLCFTARTARRVASVYSPYPRIRNSGDARERRYPGEHEW